MSDAVPAPPRSPAAVVRALGADIKLAHSVFALPFALLGAFIARDDAMAWGAFLGRLGLVVVCMVLARSWAMIVNRIADRHIDARNPRTAGRALPSGAVTTRQAAAGAGACAALFCAACGGFLALFGNPWPSILALPVLLLLASYSWTKRFTALCHVVLGAALALSPVASAIAVRPGAVADAPALWWLAGFVTLWVAGFDVIYAFQDIDADRAAGLRSIPARVGWSAGAWVSRGMHAAGAACLAGAWLADGRFGAVTAGALAVVVCLLAAEHAVLARRGRAGLDLAFFTLNGVVSCVFGAAGIADLALRAGPL